jgi:chromosome segregation ATPase
MNLPPNTLRRQLEAAYRALETLGREREKWRNQVIALEASVKSAELQREMLLKQLGDATNWPLGFRHAYEASLEPLTKMTARESAMEAQCRSITDQFVGAMKMLAGIEAERNALTEYLKDKPDVIATAKAERDAVWTSVCLTPRSDLPDDIGSPARPNSAIGENVPAMAARILELVEVEGEPRVLSRLLAQMISSFGTAEFERVNFLRQLGVAEAERNALTERLGQLEAERNALNEKVTEITNELAQTQVQHTAMLDKLNAVLDELNAVYRSHSWLVTRPLRKVAAMLLQRS